MGLTEADGFLIDAGWGTYGFKATPICGKTMYELSEAQLAEKKIALLPQNLLEAVGELEKDDVVRSGLGPELAAEFIMLKRMEWTEYARHVSDWETRRYLEFF